MDKRIPTFILLLAFATASAASAADCQRLAEFDSMARTVTERFYDKTFRGLDWRGTVARYRARVDCSQDQAELANVVNGLLSELKASHTAVYTPTDLDYWALQSIFSRDIDAFPIAFAGLWAVRRDDAWYAKYVLPGSPAESAGVHAGDRLLRLNGKAFAPLDFNNDAESILVISPEHGVERAVRVVARKQSIQRAFLTASQRSTRITNVAGKRVGYFHLWSGTHPLFLESLNASLASFEAQKVDALVLDLRGGFGGASLEYLKQLEASAHLQSIPKYVLIDDGTRSGKELLAGTIKHERIATLVGSTTAGAFLGGAPYRFSADKYLMLVAVQAYVPPGVGPIEGIGVQPDIPVAPCRAYCGGKDPQLDAVMQLIGDSLGRSSS